MKKLVILVLIFAFTLSLSGCDGTFNETNRSFSDTQESSFDTKVELTANNIEDYLAIELDDRHDGYYQKLTITTYAVVGGSFNNTKITLKFDLAPGWSTNSDDSNELTCSIRLPASGNFTETYTLSFDASQYFDGYTEFDYIITAVSGSFDPAA